MAVLLAHLKVPLTWGQILHRTYQGALEDNVLGMAAQLAYYFSFALFPALLFVLALASYFPIETLIDDMLRILGGFAPPEVLTIITDQIREISQGEQGGLLTLGILMLWFYISALAILAGAEMNAEIEHASPYGKAPGEKVPGQKRTIGTAAMRDWLEKQNEERGSYNFRNRTRRTA